MLLRISSDLHLEGFTGKNDVELVNTFLPPDTRDAKSILVLAGDISSKPEQLIDFLFVAERRFKKVIYIPGNHEFYRHDYNTWISKCEHDFGACLTNTVYALGTVGFYELDGISFTFGTLWGDGGKTPLDAFNVDHGLNDFRVIKNGESRFTVHHMVQIHKAQKALIDQYLKSANGKKVVITHHMPSYRLCHPRFGNEINGGFAANCDDILAYDHAPDLWIHGHTHDTIDTTLWKTRIVANPRGYRGEWTSPYNNYTSLFVEV